MFWSLCYLALQRLLQIASLRFRSGQLKELEIVMLRHELAALLHGRPVRRHAPRRRQADLGCRGCGVQCFDPDGG